MASLTSFDAFPNMSWWVNSRSTIKQALYAITGRISASRARLNSVNMRCSRTHRINIHIQVGWAADLDTTTHVLKLYLLREGHWWMEDQIAKFTNKTRAYIFVFMWIGLLHSLCVYIHCTVHASVIVQFIVSMMYNWFISLPTGALGDVARFAR